MHSKMIFVRPAEGAEADNEEKTEGSGSSDMLKAWAYVGSANLSESAW